MKSILQDNISCCFLCGMNKNLEPLDKHHVFNGADRTKSEEYGLTVYLHHDKCHIFGKDSVHKNNEIRFRLCAYAQRRAMEHYGWGLEDWIERFGRNYLDIRKVEM